MFSSAAEDGAIVQWFDAIRQKAPLAPVLSSSGGMQAVATSTKSLKQKMMQTVKNLPRQFGASLDVYTSLGGSHSGLSAAVGADGVVLLAAEVLRVKLLGVEALASSLPEDVQLFVTFRLLPGLSDEDQQRPTRVEEHKTALKHHPWSWCDDGSITVFDLKQDEWRLCIDLYSRSWNKEVLEGQVELLSTTLRSSLLDQLEVRREGRFSMLSVRGSEPLAVLRMALETGRSDSTIRRQLSECITRLAESDSSGQNLDLWLKEAGTHAAGSVLAARKSPRVVKSEIDSEMPVALSKSKVMGGGTQKKTKKGAVFSFFFFFCFCQVTGRAPIRIHTHSVQSRVSRPCWEMKATSRTCSHMLLVLSNQPIIFTPSTRMTLPPAAAAAATTTSLRRLSPFRKPTEESILTSRLSICSSTPSGKVRSSEWKLRKPILKKFPT